MQTDLWGKALLDYFHGDHRYPLTLHTSYGEPEQFPLDLFFRDQSMFSDLELFACELCQGTILDIGAGAGCHSRVLQESGLQVTSLEISAGACQVMRSSGVTNVIESDIYDFSTDGFNTALMMMNGLGIAGTLDNLKNLLSKVISCLRPGGQIIADSSDIAYFYLEDPMPDDRYYGELEYQYEYRGLRGEPFPWLFVDYKNLLKMAGEVGLQVQMVYQGNHQYLVRMTR